MADPPAGCSPFLGRNVWGLLDEEAQALGLMSPGALPTSDSEKSKKSKPESDDAGSEEILLPELCADIDAGDNSESAAPGPGGPPLVRKGKRKASAKAKRSSCPKPKAKAVAKAKQKGKAEYPPGSQETIDDFNLWAEELFRALKQHLAAIGEHDVHKMWEELSKITVVLTTSYSGVGSPEWAVLFLLQAFRDLGYSLNIIFYSACDCDKLCQSLLMAHHQKPMHVFSDLCSRLPADPFFELKTLQKNYIEQYSQERERAEGSGAGFGKKEKKMLAKQLGDDFFEEACTLLSEVIFDKNTTCWCVACKKMCKVFPSEVLTDNAIWIEVGGNTCTPWSVAGASRGWLDPASLASLVWGWWLGQTQPTHVINECTPTWPAVQFFKAVLTYVYTIQSIKICPSNFAVPCRRPRIYTTVSRNNATQRILQLEVFLPTYVYRSVVLDPNIFFCAPQEVQNKCLGNMLAARGIAIEQHLIDDMRLVMTFACRQRRTGYKVKWVEQGLTGPKLCNISQNAWFRTKLDELMPTLLKNSMIWNFEINKLLLGPEHFVVNGAPIFCQGREGIMAIKPEVFVNMPYRRAAKVSGNMMHITVVGMVLGSILFGTTHADIMVGCTSRW